MLTRTLIVVFGFVLLAGCTTSYGGDEFEIERSTQERNQALDHHWNWKEVLLFDTGVVCVTDPCPRYRVVDRLGFGVDIARVSLRVDLPGDEIDAAGLVVKAKVYRGDWSPGALGNILRVADVRGTPAKYLVYDAGTRARFVEDVPIGLIGTDHSVGTASDLRLDLLHLDAEDEQRLQDGLYAGRYVVTGWLTQNWWGQRAELFVTGIAEATQFYTVRETGKVCITAPCPIYEIRDVEGNFVGEAASLDFRVIGLTAKQEEVLRNRLREGHPVRGLCLEGAWEPGATGTVLYVTEDTYVL